MNVEHDEPQAPVAENEAPEATGDALAQAVPAEPSATGVVLVPPAPEPHANVAVEVAAEQNVLVPAEDSPPAVEELEAAAAFVLPEVAEPEPGPELEPVHAPSSVEVQDTGGPLPPEEPLPATPTTPEPTHPPEPPEAPPLPDHPRLRRHPAAAPAMIAIDRIDEDTTFQMRDEGDLSLLATDLARLGQLFPVDVRLKPPDRFQLICGFRRVAALRFLQRDRVLARLHTDLSDEDALLMALVSAIHARPVEASELESVKARLKGQGRLSPSIRSMLEKALQPDDDLAPETVGDQEVDADELAQDVTLRLGELNQDLSLLAEAFDSLDRVRQDQLLEQLRYSSELVAYLEGRR